MSTDKSRMEPNPPYPAVGKTRPWSRGQRTVASVLLALHVAAVFIAPWSFPPPRPLLAQSLADTIRPYLVATYLNHGYRFFAPNPGPSHIVRFEATRSDGTVEKGSWPDRNSHHPRLLYHRYFMMTESLFAIRTNIENPPEGVLIPEDRLKEIQARNASAESRSRRLSQGLANQILQRFDADRVRLTLVEHAIPFPEDVEQGMRLDAPELYTDLADLGEFTKDGASP